MYPNVLGLFLCVFYQMVLQTTQLCAFFHTFHSLVTKYGIFVHYLYKVMRIHVIYFLIQMV